MTNTHPLVPSPAPAVLLAPFYTPTPQAADCTRDFFTTQLHNDHTRVAYLNATRRFAVWCKPHGLELADVKPFHVAAFLKELQDEDHQPKPFSKPTVKLHLAALRMLFDWMVIGQVIPDESGARGAAPNMS
jgi:site-specific recombinase XerD